MADIRAFVVGNFASVSSTSFFTITVEDIQRAATVSGLHIVLIRGPDRFPIFPPAHIYSLGTSERNSKRQGFADSECCVFQLSDEANRFYEKQ